MLWFNFILGLNVIFFCFILIIMSLSYITIPKNKSKQNLRIKIELQHNIIYLSCFSLAETCTVLLDSLFE